MSTDFSVYYAILNDAPKEGIVSPTEYLRHELPDFWCYEYEKMTFTEDYPYSPDELQIMSIPLDRVAYLYDMGDTYDEGDRNNLRVESRIVAAYGYSQSPKTLRDVSRMRGWLGATDQYPRFINSEMKYDKGHFIAHQSGGGLDINLFFQRRDINRGWSESGKIYRAMEKYCAVNLGTFCFSRPFYNDRSWHPCAIEYGLVTQEGKFWVERFEN